MQLRLVRQLGMRKLAEEDVEAVRASGLPGSCGTSKGRRVTWKGKQSRCITEAYAKGVNWYAGRAAAAGRLPLEFKLTGQGWEPWTLADS
eukprot:6169284-Amphidinium_carterae.1